MSTETQLGALGDEAAASHSDKALDPYVPDIVVDWLVNRPEERATELDATLVFADVSGFTPLSERLARKGKVGAEELTDILNRVFGRLLDHASAFGGDLLKFGGDALLLLFTGDDHACRGTAAAAEMQVELKHLGRIDTGSGVVRLRMSVGVHSGPMLLFLVGSSHRELLITGPGATETVRMESAADAAEILLSPSTAARVPERWVGAEKEGGRLARIPRVAGALAPLPFARRRHPVAALGVPACLREFLVHAPAEGEHRQATLAFLQFKGLDALLASEGVDAVADALHELMSLAQDASAAHDVTLLATDVDADGGKILFSTGAPLTSVNDDDRMLQAMRQIVDAAPRLDIRAGVNRGHAFAVDVGAPYRRTYAVMGDPTNLAARVMGKAPMRGVLATSAVLDRLRTDFELMPLEPFMVKGKSEPIEASVVGSVVGTRRAFARESGAMPLLGRDDERQTIERALHGARAGRGTVVALVGEPGLGKSRLVEEARAMAADMKTVVIEGGQYATLSPYFAVRAPMRALLGVTLADADDVVMAALISGVRHACPELAPWVPLLAIPLGVTVPDTDATAALHPDFRRAKLDEVTTQLLAALLDVPTMIVLEDAHWLDDASSAMLRAAIDETQNRPWVVCVSRRPEEGGLDVATDDDAIVLRLAPLTASVAEQLVVAASEEAPLPPDIVAKLAERSGGNPLFLQELLDAARTGGSIDDLPDAVEPLIAARIDTLSPADRQLLRTASVLGVRFPQEILAELVADDVGPGMLDGALRRLTGFLLDEGVAVRFRHALLRQVAYESLPFRRRRSLHAAAGELLERRMVSGAERPTALLSMHFFEAQRYADAWRYAREAAETARDRWAPSEAAVLYERAVESARRLRSVPDDALADVCFEWGKSAQRAGRYEVAASAYRAARRLWRDQPLQLARVAAEEGWLQEHRGAYSEALRRYTSGKKVLAAMEPSPEVQEVVAKLLVSYGAVRLRQGRYRDGVPYVKQAAAVAGGLGDTRKAKEILAHAYYLLDWAYTDLGDPDVGTWRELALPIYEELEDFHGAGGVLNNLGIDAYYEGRWAESLELYEQARVALERSGDAMRVASTLNNIGEVLSDQGRLGEAEELFRTAWRIWKSLDSRAAAACAINNLGRIASRAGRLDEAAARFDEAAQEFEACGAKAWLLEVDARRAERALFDRQPDDAIALADSVKDRAAKLGAPAVLVALVDRLAGWGHVQRGEFEAARERLTASLAVARTAGSSYEIALTLLAIAAAARSCEEDDDGAAAEREARQLLDDLGVVAIPEIPLAARSRP